MEVREFLDTLVAAGRNLEPAGTKIALSNPRLKRAPEDLRKFVGLCYLFGQFMEQFAACLAGHGGQESPLNAFLQRNTAGKRQKRQLDIENSQFLM